MASSFEESYLGQLRKQVGSRLVLMPAVRVVIQDEHGRILLHLRRDFPVWGIPGGHPEEGESIREAAIREVREETGLTLRSVDAYGFSSRPETETLVYPNGHQVHSFALLLHSRDWEGSLQAQDDESLELRFFGRDELPEAMFPHERACLEEFFAFERSGRFFWS